MRVTVLQSSHPGCNTRGERAFRVVSGSLVMPLPRIDDGRAMPVNQPWAEASAIGVTESSSSRGRSHCESRLAGESAARVCPAWANQQLETFDGEAFNLPGDLPRAAGRCAETAATGTAAARKRRDCAARPSRCAGRAFRCRCGGRPCHPAMRGTCGWAR